MANCSFSQRDSMTVSTGVTAESVQKQKNAIYESFSDFTNAENFNKHINLKKASVVECIDMFMRENRVRKNINSFNSLKRRIQQVEETQNFVLYPIVVCERFMRIFDSFLDICCNLASSTRCAYIMQLKTVLRWAREYEAPISSSFEKYKPTSSPFRPKVYLSDVEICKLYFFDIDKCKFKKVYKETLKKVRDQFVLSCYLGQRYSDCRRISQNNFDGPSKDVFKITQQKTGNIAVVDFRTIFKDTPDIVKEILEKYNYTAPYPYDISVYNKHLHTICKLAGLNDEVLCEQRVNGQIVQRTYKKYELISSHCGRRTFVTNAVHRNLQSQMIMRATGHKTNSSFDKYMVWKD